jgi:cytochrome c oxidase assembly protein subunit 15
MKPAEKLWTAVAVGFGTSVAMWCLGFLGRIPAAPVPGSVLLPLLLLALALGGARAGRAPGGGVGAGMLAGLAASVVNLLVLGSVLAGRESAGAAVWVPASLAIGLGLGAAGGVVGARLGPRELAPTSALAKVAAFATLLLLVLGGLVTSQDAGLAVVDWPNSFGSPMFLFPLAKMVGGIYYEHSHRLFGSLVGLVTVVLAIRLLAAESRGRVKAMGVAAVAFVILQGILGGLRVTGHFTWSASPEATRPSLALAMVHGATGQIFFAFMVALVAVTSRTWRTAPSSVGDPADASADRLVSGVLLAVLLGQLLLGIRVRHLGEGVMAHITFAVLVLLVAVGAGVRTITRHRHVPVLRKTGAALIGHVTTQFLLGGLALVAVSRARDHGAGAFDVLATTAHQTVGALLLANATLLALWARRLLPASAAAPADEGEARPATGRT